MVSYAIKNPQIIKQMHFNAVKFCGALISGNNANNYTMASIYLNSS